MREIRFRGWNGESMEYGGFCIHARGDIQPLLGLSRLKRNSPIMQYTGLKDKNGGDIYEGDVVKVETGVGYSSNHHPSFADGTQRVDIIIVEYEGCGFNLAMPLDINYDQTFSIIGNIYQSPELLEEVHDV